MTAMPSEQVLRGAEVGCPKALSADLRNRRPPLTARDESSPESPGVQKQAPGCLGLFAIAELAAPRAPEPSCAAPSRSRYSLHQA